MMDNKKNPNEKYNDLVEEKEANQGRGSQILQTESEAQKGSFSYALKGLYSDDEVLEDISAKQMKTDCEVLNKNQDWNSQDFKKWLKFYVENAATHHEIDPETLFSRHDSVSKMLFLEKKTCVVEAYENGEISFYELATRKRIVIHENSDKVVSLKANRSQTILGLAYTNSLVFINLSDFSILNTLDFYYCENLSFAISDDEDKVCLGLNPLTKCGLSIWNIKESKYEMYNNNDYENDPISEVIWDKTGTRIFFMTHYFKLSVWILQSNATRCLDTTLTCRIDKPPFFLALDQYGQRIYWAGWTYQDDFYVNCYDITNEGEEAKIFSEALNFTVNMTILTKNPSDSFIYVESEEKDVLIRYDYTQRRESQRFAIGKSEHDFLAFFKDEPWFYNKKYRQILAFRKDQKFTIQYNLKDFKALGTAPPSFSLKPYELSADIKNLVINPYNRSLAAVYSEKKISIFDFLTLKILKEIEFKEKETVLSLLVEKNSLFIDSDHVMYFASHEENKNYLIHQNIYSAKRNTLFVGFRKISTFSYLNNNLVYFSYEDGNEIFVWKLDSDYKNYSKQDCEKVFSFDDEVGKISCLRKLSYLVVNLVASPSFYILEVLDQTKGTPAVKKAELRGHTRDIYDFQVIQSKNLLVSVCEERKIIVWELEKFQKTNMILAGRTLNLNNEDGSEIIKLTFGEDGKYMAAGFKKSIYIWNLQNSFLVTFFRVAEEVSFLTFDSEKNELYSYTSSSCLLQKWIHEKNHKIFTKNKIQDNIYYCAFSPNLKYLMLQTIINKKEDRLSFLTWPNQKLVRQIDMPKNPNEQEQNSLSDGGFYSFQWTQNNEGVLLASYFTLMFFYLGEREPWDIRKTSKMKDEIYLITDIVKDGDNYIFYLIFDEGNFFRCTMNVETHAFLMENESQLLKLEDEGIVSAAIHPLFQRLIAIGTDYGGLMMYDTLEKKQVRSFDDSEYAATFLKFSRDGKKLCSCHENGEISFWDVASESLDSKLLGHKYVIRYVDFNHAGNKLLSWGDDCTIRIWNIQTKTLERLIELDDDVSLYSCEFFSEGNCILAGFNQGMLMNLYGFEYYIQQSYSIFLLQNNLTDFDYLCTLFRPWNLNQLAFNFIRPFGFSLLHSLFYLGFFEEMYVFIKLLRFHKCKFTFFVDCTNKTIIDLLLQKKSSKVLSFLIEYLIECPPTEEFISDQFHNSILSLVSYPLPSIEVFLDSLIRSFQPKGDYYSQRDPEITQFAITVKNVHPLLEEMKTKFPYPEDPNENSRLGFQLVSLKNVCDPNVGFCEKLKNYPNTHKIFQSKLVTNLIEYKWETYAKNVHLKRFFNFFFFTLLATVNSYFLFIERNCYTENETYAYASFFTEVIIFLFFFLPYIVYELKEVSKTGLAQYFDEFWNWIDLISLILFILLFVLDFCDIFFFSTNSDLLTTMKIIHALFIFVIWLKVLSFSIIYEGTAFIYTALIKIIQELRHFLLLLLLITIMLSFLVYILQDLYPDQDEDYEDSDYTKMTRLEILFVAYKMILGDYDDFFTIKPTLGAVLFKILFVLVTIVLFIILMNFIISLVSMVFSDVVAVKTLTYLYEKNKIIAEIDRSMSVEEVNRLKKQKEMNAFLLICQTNVPEEFDSSERKKDEKPPITTDEKGYLYTKIQNYSQEKIKFIFGSSCEACKKELKEMEPQYYCYFCNIYFCSRCGDKIDKTKKGSYSLIHPHNLVWMDVKNSKGMQAIDSYKMGVPRIFEANDKDFGVLCNGCDHNEYIANSRWICLSCRPGKFKAGQLVEFCEDCMNVIRKKENSADMKRLLRNLEKNNEDHDNDSHIYLRVMFAQGDKAY